MTKPVMTTRCIGQATHYSGHPLAPMEYVYVCEEPVRSTFWQRLWGLSAGKKLGLLSILYLGFAVVRAAIYVATGNDITG
jgi:hypothetical protein